MIFYFCVFDLVIAGEAFRVSCCVGWGCRCTCLLAYCFVFGGGGLLGVQIFRVVVSVLLSGCDLAGVGVRGVGVCGMGEQGMVVRGVEVSGVEA